jgi:hypothetical protein
MRHEEKYCIWSGSSIGGCPLEEASEQERIPSIIGSIVWCCPTSRVFSNKVCSFYGEWFMVYSWYFGIFVDLVLVLNNWYQSTFLGRSCGQLFFIFADFFFRRRKKRAATFQTFSVYFCEKFVEKGCISEFLSEKHPS